MTDISVVTTSWQVEDRQWLSSDFGVDEPRSITLDVSLFTAATHYPDGFIKSGIILGRISSGGLVGAFGPYLDAASDGRQTAVGVLFSSVKVPNVLNTAIDVGAAMMEMGLLVEAKLPIANGATGGGYIDANGKTDLAGWFKFL